MALLKVVRGAPTSSMDGIAWNSLSIANGDMVSLSAGFVVKATASTGKIAGFANGTKVYAADNQTVAKANLNFLVTEVSYTVVELATSAATLTQADIGKYYLVNSAQVIDVTTGRTFKSAVNTSDAGVAADIVTDYQFQLVDFVSTSRGQFMVV